MSQLHYGVIFDPPKQPDPTADIIPSFCQLGTSASTSTPAQPASPDPLFPAAPAFPVSLRSLFHPEPLVSTLPPAAVSSPSSSRIKPYDAAQEFMGKLPICRVGEAFYVYQGRAYQAVTQEQLGRYIMEVCRPAVQADGFPKLVHQVCDILRSEGRLERAEIDQRFVSFANGLLNLVTGELLLHTPQVLSTAQVNAKYDPHLAGQHPAFSRFLTQISGADPVLEQRVWQIIGYALVPDTAAKAFFLLQGVPNSGKSLLGDFLTRLLPPDAATSLNLNDLGRNFGPSELLGKQLCLSMDLPATPWDSKAVGMLKALTGNDLVTADVKYQPRVKFRNTATFLFGTNHAVSLTQPDLAFLQRLVVIPFRYSVPKERQDRQLLSKLLSERDAIVASALNAYWELRRNNYTFAGDYALNAIIAHDPASSLSLTQAVAEFFYTHCSLDPKRETFASDLYEVFNRLFPGAATYEAFAARFSNFVMGTYPDQVTKRRTRRPGEANPTSLLVGIRLRDEPGILRLPSCIS